jgi:DNA-binding NarL/FixJ family response regulator
VRTEGWPFVGRREESAFLTEALGRSGVDAHGAAGRAASARASAARARALLDGCEGARLPFAPAAGADAAGLTDRECEIATLAARGLSNEEIAAQLVLSVRTVENHLQRAYTKLGVAGRRELGGVLGVGEKEPA